MKSLSKHSPALTGDLFVERGMVVRSRGEHRQRDVCSLVQILDILSLQIRKLEKHVYQKYGHQHQDQKDQQQQRTPTSTPKAK